MSLHTNQRAISATARQMGEALLTTYIQNGTDRPVEESDIRALGFSAEEITAHGDDARAYAQQAYNAQIRDLAA
mgnify:CR=1 FL=1